MPRHLTTRWPVRHVRRRPLVELVEYELLRGEEGVVKGEPPAGVYPWLMAERVWLTYLPHANSLPIVTGQAARQEEALLERFSTRIAGRYLLVVDPGLAMRLTGAAAPGAV